LRFIERDLVLYEEVGTSERDVWKSRNDTRQSERYRTEWRLEFDVH